MELSRIDLERYDARLSAVSDAAADFVRGRVDAFLKRFPKAPAEDVRNFAIECVNDAVAAYGDAASTVAANLYDDFALAAGRKLPPAMLDDTDVSQYVDKEVRYQMTKLLSGKPSEFADRCGLAARNQVSRRANGTVARNAARDGVRYARVPMGCGCTFCAMLASRGFAYRSAKSAGEGSHYHDHCRCKAVPEFGGVEGYDPAVWEKRWQEMKSIDNDERLTSEEKQGARNAVGNGDSYEEWLEDSRRATVDFKPDVQIGRSVGAAARRDKVMLPDGTITKTSEGTRITKIVTIAGKGTGKKIRVEDHLCEKYGGKRGNWEKCRGSGYVDDLGMKRPCELHWFEEEDAGRVDMKVKRFYA